MIRPRVGTPLLTRSVSAGAALAALLLAAAGCTSSTPPRPAGTAAVVGPTSAVSATTSGGASRSPTRSPTSHPPTSPRSSPATRPTKPVEEKPGACPYISNQRVADIEGNRVGRSTIVTTTPPGCRFYFLYGDQHMTTRITVKRYPSAVAAYNRVARTGGPRAFSTPGIGDAAVLYQTRFYRPDGDRDWACTFARGRHVVTVLTDQTDPSTNARNLARAIADRI